MDQLAPRVNPCGFNLNTHTRIDGAREIAGLFWCLLPRGQDFFGTLAPFLRAFESPIATACLRLVTFPPLPPLPDFSVPFFLRCIALFTLLPAAFSYLRPVDFFVVISDLSFEDCFRTDAYGPQRFV